MADISEDDLFQGLDISEDDLFEGTTEEEKGLIARTVFPTSTSMEMGDVKSFAKRTLQAGIDASTFPTRLSGMLRGFDISDPKSALLQPEIEKVEEAAETTSGAFQEKIDAIFKKAESEGRSITFKENLKVQSLIRGQTSIKGAAVVGSEVLREAPTLGVGGIAKKGLKVAERAAKSGINTASRIGEEISNLSKDAFEFIKKGTSDDVAKLQKAVDTFDDIGLKLKDLVFGKSDDFFPEKAILDKSFANMPDFPLERTLQSIKTEIAKLNRLGAKTHKASITKLENLLDDVGNGRVVGGGTQRVPGQVTQEAASSSPTTIDIPGRVTKEGVMLPPQSQSIAGKTVPQKTNNMGRVIQPEANIPPSTINLPGRKISDPVSIPGQTQYIPGRQIRGEVRSPSTTIKTQGKKVFNKDANAVLFREQRTMIDDLIDWTRPGNKAGNKSLINIRTSMANEIITQADKVGDKVVASKMKELASKNKSLDKLKLRMDNEETFIATLKGKNKSARQRALKEVDAEFGTSFSKDTDLAKIASEFDKGTSKLNTGDFTTVDGKVALSVPRGKNVLGKVISPRAAAGISNLVDLSSLRVLGQLPSELAASGITQAQIGSLINFFEGQGTTP